MRQKANHFAIIFLILLLTGCNGISIDYLRARATYLLSNQADQPITIDPTATHVPTKLVTLQNGTPIPPITNEQPTQTAMQAPTISASPTPSDTPLPAAIDLNAYVVGFSSDGKILAFNSSIPGLVPEDQDQTLKAFVYQTESQSIQWIQPDQSLSLEKIPSSAARSLSADGRFLLYGGGSKGADPVTKPYDFTYLRDLVTGKDELIDFMPLKRQYSLMSISPALSPDGQFLSLEVSSGGLNVLLLDRSTRTVTPVGGSLEGGGLTWTSFHPAFSPDGRYLAFVSDLSDLVEGDTPCSDTNPLCGDVFLYDIATSRLERIPAQLQFTQGNPYPSLTLSADARFLAWTEVEDRETHYRPVIRLFDRNTGRMETICAGEDFCSGHSPTISNDGRWLAFGTEPPPAPNSSWDPAQPGQVYLLDRQTGALTRVSAATDRQPGDAASGIIQRQSAGWTSDIHISGDGRFVAFSSQAANLLPTSALKRLCFDPFLSGAYACYDVFIYDVKLGKLSWISAGKGPSQ